MFIGNPKPLVFHIPQKFFDCLERRISGGIGKRRLPNSAESIVRVDSPPLETFTKYTWKIGSILHVKQIFDNSKVNSIYFCSFFKLINMSQTFLLMKFETYSLNFTVFKNRINHVSGQNSSPVCYKSLSLRSIRSISAV